MAMIADCEAEGLWRDWAGSLPEEVLVKVAEKVDVLVDRRGRALMEKPV